MKRFSRIFESSRKALKADQPKARHRGVIRASTMCVSSNSATTISKPVNRKEKNQGMNWVCQQKRLAIYLRDGLACAYCGNSVTEGAKLTLDHLTPYSHGGSNEYNNLVTCCAKCNSSRGNRTVETFAEGIAGYLGIAAQCIISHVQACISRPVDTKTAGEIIKRQGSCFKALQNL